MLIDIIINNNQMLIYLVAWQIIKGNFSLFIEMLCVSKHVLFLIAFHVSSQYCKSVRLLEEYAWISFSHLYTASNNIASNNEIFMDNFFPFWINLPFSPFR